MVDVSMMCDDLLDNRRSDLWLRRWWWRWGRWQGLRRGRALFHTANDYFVLNDFALTRSSRLLARAANNKFLMLAGNELSTRTGRRERSLAASYDQRVSLYASVPAIAAELAARGADVKVAVSLLEANGATLSRDIAAVTAEFLVRGTDVYVVAAASETDVLPLDADLTWASAVAAAEGDVALEVSFSRRGSSRLLAAPDSHVELLLLALYFAAATASRVAASNGDIVYLALSYARGRGRGTAPHGNSIVVVEASTTASRWRWSSRESVLVALSSTQYHGPCSRAVVAEEVGGTAARVAAPAKLNVKLLIVAVAAVAVAVEVALTLLIQLGGRVAARHGARGLRMRGGSAKVVG